MAQPENDTPPNRVVSAAGTAHAPSDRKRLQGPSSPRTRESTKKGLIPAHPEVFAVSLAEGIAVGSGTAVSWTRQVVGVAYDWLAYWILVAAASVVPGIEKPGKRGPKPGAIDRYGEGRRALFPELATLMKDERLTAEQAAKRLADAGKVPGTGTVESLAHSLAKMFRDEAGN